MPWTQEQCESVFEDYWRRGRSTCPNDESVVTLQITPFIGGQYMVSGFCPRCGDGIQMGRNHDPRRADFRSWSDDERSTLVNAYFQQRHADCPVCDSSVDVQSSAYFGGNIVSMRCIRCGNSHQQEFPRNQ